ncbi:tRNA (guanine-N7)-methyltransferase [Aerococcus urinaehominis]|uniref:tRNA (guanine-N(7)-)-methyltransferase n=1 Tax=Aerococcus urinaehominis TaxID=128944 RepID=A0A0X8FM37_9LACT|nr:tRNA (guanosine(46)-N7)-methyltransferase TrmB [Aerococcus urinaehominis]AMB99589.1 tRNA (guanine-N7)-methyltransferase [Aerococcus urinaehominis]SDL86600.1 tRNA (guanine-N7-)-methyltransferase [Aerococcus urinaehominis]
MRVRHKPWAQERLAADNDFMVQTPSQFQGEWGQKVFNNQNDIHVEVGSGKGNFIVGMAQAHPDINFIGIELQASVFITALEKAQAVSGGLDNLKLVLTDGQNLNDIFADDELQRIYLNFSDPWPKKRHAKRRLTHKNFLAVYQQVLDERGNLHFKTDNQALFEYSLVSMSKYGMVLDWVSLDLHHSDYIGNIMTEYEEKFSKKGQVIYRLEASFPVAN